MPDCKIYYVLVKPFLSCKALWYQSSINLDINSIVSIQIRNSNTFGIIKEISINSPLAENIKIKFITKKIELKDLKFKDYIAKLAFLYQVSEEIIYAKLSFFLDQVVEPTELKELAEFDLKLTEKQATIAFEIEKNIGLNVFAPSLIYGVTGSGKTAIYKYLIYQALIKNLSVIIISPEITIATQCLAELKKHFKDYVFCLHSGITPTERKKLWQALNSNKGVIILGVQLPTILPVSNLGLIIVDEEHETGYQEKNNPHFNSRDCLMIRAQNYKIPIVLGSATPTVNTYYLFKKNNWPIFELRARFGGAKPNIKLVYFKYDKKRTNFWITSNLEKEIKERLIKKEQTLIFLNRRGYSFFLRCENCQEIPICKSCSVSLTPHEDLIMRCHYCNYSKKIISKCHQCQNEVNFLHKGIGTQQLVQIIKKMFPSANVARADLDITKSKKKWLEITENMANNTIDILIGTQTIAKGLHFPNVSLVGVLWADLNLNLPQYNAQEKTLQQLLQVSGRAGRELKESSVIIQAMNNHPIFDFLDENKYLNFLEKEIETRKEVLYPPICRFIRIEIKNKNQIVANQEAILIAQQFQNNNNTKIFGPLKPSVEKIEGIFKEYIYIKTDDIINIINNFKDITLKYNFKSLISFNPNPLD